MKLTSRSIAAIIAVAALALPAAAAAKTYKVSMATKGSKVDGTKLTGTWNGNPLGRCSGKGKLLIPDTIQTWKCKGGTVSFRSHATQVTDNTKGTWKITGGTRKFKGIKGGGTFTGKISAGNYRFVGKARF